MPFLFLEGYCTIKGTLLVQEFYAVTLGRVDLSRLNFVRDKAF